MEKYKFSLEESRTEKDFIKWDDKDIELLLDCTKQYKTEKEFDSIDWETVKSKYEDIRAIFVQNRGESCTATFTKDRVTTKLKSIRTNYRKAIDSGRSSGGGRIVAIFWDVCHEIWGNAPISIDIHLDSNYDSQDASSNNTRNSSSNQTFNEGESHSKSNETESRSINPWRVKRPARDSIQDFTTNHSSNKIQRREEEPAVHNPYMHYQNRPLSSSRKDEQSPINSPSHFVETMGIVVEAHTKQQQAWMDMANKREELFLQREERFFQREERFLQREERFLQTEERFLKLFQEEGERNRQHQLKLAELYATSNMKCLRKHSPIESTHKLENGQSSISEAKSDR